MSEHLKGPGRFFLLLLAGIFAVGFGAQWNLLVLILGLPLFAVVTVVGALFYSVRGLKRARALDQSSQRVTIAVAAPVMMIITLLVAWPSIFAGGVFRRFDEANGQSWSL